MGWPTTATPPEVFRTVWINIEDPDKLNRTPGAIYYWLRDLDEAGIPSTVPRAYRVEWSVQSAVLFPLLDTIVIANIRISVPAWFPASGRGSRIIDVFYMEKE